MNKKFDILLKDGCLTAEYNGKTILENLRIKINLINKKLSVFMLADSVETGNDESIKVIFKRDPELHPWYIPDIDSVVLTASEQNGVIVFSLDVKFSKQICSAEYMFDPENSIEFNYDFAEDDCRIVCNYMRCPYWLYPSFGTGKTDCDDGVSESVHFSGGHMHIMPLVNESGTSRICKHGVCINVGKLSVNSYNDDFLAISVDKNPYDAIVRNFNECKVRNLICVNLRDERVMHEMFKYFGWCTWDACYHNVTSEILYKKLDEFKEKNIKLKWLLIDDGWSQYSSAEDKDSPRALLSFEEDRTKFPEGLKACIKRIKEEYGVEYVGVWQSFTGYWVGVSKKSGIVSKHPESVKEIFTGKVLPAFDEEGAYAFWSKWNGYLKEQGVDFVKVDTQGSFNSKFLNENTGVFEGLKIQYDAWEKSIFECFDGRVINCMGMGNENFFARRKTALSRNSGDFMPKQEIGFSAHLTNNVYNVPFHSMLYYCDFDMWWSEHETALQSAVLRAMSGGPVYTSDEVGHSDSLYINPIYDENGRIYDLDDFAKPTYDCYYSDCAKEEKPLKVFNKKDDKFIVAAFGVAEKKSCGKLRLSDLGLNNTYVIENYFTGEIIKMDDETAIDISLDKNECVLYNLYPVDKDGKAFLGRRDKFVGIGTEVVREINVADL